MIYVIFSLIFIAETVITQEFGWKEIFKTEGNSDAEYLDTLNIDTVNNLIFFYVKEVHYKYYGKFEDSVYSLYAANIEKPELYLIS